MVEGSRVVLSLLIVVLSFYYELQWLISGVRLGVGKIGGFGRGRGWRILPPWVSIVALWIV